jgi:hypothetical protein
MKEAALCQTRNPKPGKRAGKKKKIAVISRLPITAVAFTWSMHVAAEWWTHVVAT